MYPLDIKQLHIELTERCQASCPMCLRNFHGGPERELVTNAEISLEKFKQWFPVEFLKGLDNIYSCGSLGDPAIAKDCLEILEYIREHNTDCRLALHTNGSLRTVAWWEKLAAVLGNNGEVVFGIDGFKGEHEVYRRGTDWDKIIENAKAFISAGGNAKADCLVFKHNEQRIEELEKFLLGIGFSSVNFKVTNRFHGCNTFEVINKNKEFEYYLEPPTKDKWKSQLFAPNIVSLVKIENYNKLISDAVIDPICQKNKELFVDARGRVFPCCWTASFEDENIEVVDPSIRVLRERLHRSTVDMVQDIGIVSLEGTNIVDAMKKSNWDSSLEKHWSTEKKFVCVKSCASNKNIFEK